MNPFVDAYLPDNVPGLPCQVQPRFSTRIDLAKSGDEARNQNWMNPLRKFMLPESARDDNIDDILTFWLVMGGPFRTWPFRDPLDFSSAPIEGPGVEPPISGLDQEIAVGDGSAYQFQIIKTRVYGPVSYVRPIYFPVLDTVEILIAGFAPAAVPSLEGGPYVVEGVSRPGGIITLNKALQGGVVMTAGFYFDTEVRFEADDTFDNIMHSSDTAGASPINLVEVRRC